MNDTEKYIEPAIALAREELPDGGVKVMTCPKCYSKVTILIATENDKTALRCQTGTCLKTGPDHE